MFIFEKVSKEIFLFLNGRCVTLFFLIFEKRKKAEIGRNLVHFSSFFKQMTATNDQNEVEYKPLNVENIMRDNVQKRVVYMGIKKFITEELSGCDLVGKKAAVLEAVTCCIELGVGPGSKAGLRAEFGPHFLV